MKNTLNTYFAVLLVTLAGAGATMLIVHIATTDVLAATSGENRAVYASLQQSILESR